MKLCLYVTWFKTKRLCNCQCNFILLYMLHSQGQHVLGISVGHQLFLLFLWNTYKKFMFNMEYKNYFIVHIWYKLSLHAPCNVKDIRMAHKYGQNMSCASTEVSTVVWLRIHFFWYTTRHHGVMVPNILKEHIAIF
jgi:hypothetical protein